MIRRQILIFMFLLSPYQTTLGPLSLSKRSRNASLAKGHAEAVTEVFFGTSGRRPYIDRKKEQPPHFYGNCFLWRAARDSNP